MFQSAKVKNMVDSWVDMELKQSRVCLGRTLVDSIEKNPTNPRWFLGLGDGGLLCLDKVVTVRMWVILKEHWDSELEVSSTL